MLRFEFPRLIPSHVLNFINLGFNLQLWEGKYLFFDSSCTFAENQVRLFRQSCTSCDLKKLSIANGGKFVFSLIKQSLHLLGGKKWSFLFLTNCLAYTKKFIWLSFFQIHSFLTPFYSCDTIVPCLFRREFFTHSVIPAHPTQ